MATPEFAGVVACDAGPLIHLDELRCLDLLRDFAEVVVPDGVRMEVQRHRPSALRRRSVKIRYVSSLPEADAELTQLAHAFLLGAGELAVLRLMRQSPQAIFLTDDAAARLVAQRLGYEVHGTIGVVIRALRRQQRTKRQVVNLLRSVPHRSTLFVEPQIADLRN